MSVVDPIPSHEFGLTAKLASRIARRFTGAPIDMASIGVAARIPAFLRASSVMERFFIGRRAVSGQLLELVAVRAAAELGCAHCLDIGSYMLASKYGLAEDKLRALSSHEHSTLFTDAERAALDLAVAMSATPPTITAALQTRLRQHFDDRQRLELAAMIAWENHRSRLNLACGLTAQGYTEFGSCAIVPPATTAVPAAV
jgi:alkylhydroperoxidase family enzyme